MEISRLSSGESLVFEAENLIFETKDYIKRLTKTLLNRNDILSQLHKCIRF